jgi:cystathionine beta-lyase family protein involved in aluminum resistance
MNIAADADRALADIFAEIDEVSFYNTDRIIDAFREHRVSDAMFGATSGYGYDDKGRDTLHLIWADVSGW